MNWDSQNDTALELAALRRLDLVDPVHVVRWAAEQLATEPTSPSLVELASLTQPIRASEVDGLLTQLLEGLGAPLVTEEQAGLLVARRIAQEIVDGSVEPAVGARKIWWDVARRVPAVEGQLREFIGLASEWEDNPDHRGEYENDIIDAALRFIEQSQSPDLK
jgi:hypothetical protein